MFKAPLMALLLAAPVAIHAFPPAPDHLIFGIVRDELGNPLNLNSAFVYAETAAGTRLKTRIIPTTEPGVNYRLKVPMDSGLTADRYKPTALQPSIPFKMSVVVGNTTYLPIEMKLKGASLGEPGQKTRIDLTLGEDTDNDGLPDAWERMILAARGTGSLADINGQDDYDGDGLRNVDEYLAGTYATDPEDGFELTIVPGSGGTVFLEFMAIRGRTYTVVGSSDLRDWVPVSFTIPANDPAAPPVSTYAATDVRKVQVQVAEASQNLRFFKLIVQ